MTYQQLLDILQTLTHEQLKANLSIYDPTIDEYYTVSGFGITNEDEVLDKDHPYIILK